MKEERLSNENLGPKVVADALGITEAEAKELPYAEPESAVFQKVAERADNLMTKYPSKEELKQLVAFLKPIVDGARFDDEKVEYVSPSGNVLNPYIARDVVAIIEAYTARNAE
ncbi:MAG: hypothetical protein WC988_00565 [Patescibacteria group bacterium]